ncbi:hypothetical protein [Sporosarcina sp. FSL K6-2383]|uniref:hypothetical protein n=1 Tax=Sporosarcina sp. FSL K6-2383 TaxID=2921556 RepID=UPI00315B0739
MDNDEWQWQQENAKLRKENAELKRKLATCLVGEIGERKASDKQIFTKQQTAFMKDNGLNYHKVYKLTHRYNSVEDALIEVLEGTI